MYHRCFNMMWVIVLGLSIIMEAEMHPLYAQDRREIPAKYKWNLEDIFKSWTEWQNAFERLEELMNGFVEYKGTLSSGPNHLAMVLAQKDTLEILSYKVYRYPQLLRDTDTRNQEVSAKLQNVQILFAKFNTATSWVSPELLDIPWDTMKDWLNTTPNLDPYRFGLENLYRQQEHVLDEPKEKLLSFFTQFKSSPSSIYTELSTTDIEFPTVELSTGEKVKMTSGNYGKTLALNRNQDDRKLAFETHYTVYNETKNTYAAIYNSVCQKDWASARARNYNSSLEAALDDDNIPVDVYTNLIETVIKNTKPLQRYSRIRADVLGVEEYHSYDGSINLVEFDKTYPYEKAMDWVLESIAPLGDEYQNKMKNALQGGWIDVFENTGKRPGAYSANVYGVHPYMLLNYNETLDHVFTLGHELGHTMHSLLSSETQPFATHSYTIFVAEVASTFNERLLLDYLLERSTDPKERIALLQQSIRNIVGTFYFQTLLADYEYQVHQLVEQGQPVTAKTLDGIMENLFKAYYGDSMVLDDLLTTVWARISHFYRVPFYVYQYATCFASSADLYNRIIEGDPAMQKSGIDQYLKLLKSGGNDYPMKQLKKAGVDLTQPEPILAVINQFDELVTLLDQEIKKL